MVTEFDSSDAKSAYQFYKTFELIHNLSDDQ